jgi:hypothetical protein
MARYSCGMIDGGSGVAEQLAAPVTIELRAAPEDFAALENALAAVDEPGVDLREADAASPRLGSDVWQTVLVSITSAAGLNAARDILVSYITSRRVKISITRTSTKTTVTFEGNPHSQREVERLVREITAEQSSD